MSYPNYSLVWQDEFNGTSLSSDWIYEIGTGSWGWGNNELQYYRQDNTSVENGYLIITAKQQNFGGSNYTSSRLKTQGLNFLNMVESTSEQSCHMVKVFGLRFGCWVKVFISRMAILWRD